MNILGYQYKIVYRNFDDGRMAGECDTNGGLITISAAIDPSQRIPTILHEILEVIDSHLELHLQHRAIASLEAGLHQTLIANGIDLRPLLRELESSDGRRRGKSV